MKKTLINLIFVLLAFNTFAQTDISKINWFVGNTDAGEYIEYKNVWLSAGNYRFTTQVQAEEANQTIQLEINGTAVESNIVVPHTNSFSLVHLGSMQMTEGYYDLRLVFLSGNVNCDMFFVKKDDNTSSLVLPTDIQYTAASLNDGMSVVPIGDQSFSSGGLIDIGGDPWVYKDRKGNPYTKQQVLGWYKQQSYTYTPNNSDQAMDMWVAELVAAKPDFVFMHGRAEWDITDDIEDRDYQYGVGALSGRLLKRFTEAVNRSPYAKGNLRIAYFQDNASYSMAYNLETGKTMKWDDPAWMQFTWERWFKAWYDNIPADMLYQAEPGKVPIQLWTANLSDFNNTGSNFKIKEFLEFIEAKMIATYGLKPLWVLSSTFFERDPRTRIMAWGSQAWFEWSGKTTALNSFNGAKWAFATNGKRYPFNECFLNDWDPLTGKGTVPAGGSSTDHRTSALLPNGTPLIRDFFRYSRDANAKWIVLESWSDWQEGTAWYRSDNKEWAYPNQHLALVREYSDRNTESLVFEAEACDRFYDNSFGNSGGEYRYHWHTNGEPDIDIYRPLHILSTVKTLGSTGSSIKKLSAGFQDVWAITNSNTLVSCEVDGSPASWRSVSPQKNMTDLSMGRGYTWAIGADGKTWMATLPQAWDHFKSNSWIDVSDGKKMKDIDINWKEVWGIDTEGKVYSKNLDGDFHWKLKTGAILQSITADEAFIWGLNSDGELLVNRTDGNGAWHVVANPHKITLIDAGAGELWGTNDADELYRTSSSGVTNWELVASNVSTFSVGWEYAWFIDKNGNANQYKLYGFSNEFNYQTHKTNLQNSILLNIPGTIQAEIFNNGGEGKAYHDTDGNNEGGAYRTLEGVDIEKTLDKDGDYHVGSTADGEWLEYNIANIKAGKYSINFRLASNSDNTSITASLGGEELGTLSVPNTGGLQNWQSILLKNIDIKADSNKVLRLTFKGGTVNLNYVTFFEGQAPFASMTLPGKIEAEDFDFGGDDISYHDSTVDNQGKAYRPFEGVDIQATTDVNVGYCVGWINDGEYLEFTIADVMAGLYAISFRVASAASEEKSITVSLDNVVLGKIDVPNTGGDDLWQTIKLSDLKISNGSNQVLRLSFAGGGFKLNYTSVFIDQLAYIKQTIPGIIQAENYDIGGEGIAYHDNDVINQGGALRMNESVDIGIINDIGGGNFLGWTNGGEWLEYTLSDVTSGIYNIEFRVATPNANSTVDISLDGKIICTATVPNTGDWQKWQSIFLKDVNIEGGTEKILRISHGGGFNLDYIKFDSPVLSIDQPEINYNEISIYPNPASSTATIYYQSKEAGSNILLTIFNVNGACVKSVSKNTSAIGQQQLDINVSDLKAGVYFVRFFSNGFTKTKKLVVQ